MDHRPEPTPQPFRNNIASSGAQSFGLALGGAAVAVLGPHRALAVSAALYLGCALAIRIRLPRLQPPTSPVPVPNYSAGSENGTEQRV